MKLVHVKIEADGVSLDEFTIPNSLVYRVWDHASKKDEALNDDSDYIATMIMVVPTMDETAVLDEGALLDSLSINW